jgi:hypothetical protein
MARFRIQSRGFALSLALLALFAFLAIFAFSAPTPTAKASPEAQANLFQLFLLNNQADVELLADEVFGEGVRPENWTANQDVESPLFVVDLWLNNELLADAVFDSEIRPEEWFGATSSQPEILGRNIRHDLEILADDVYGSAQERPEAWAGAGSIYRCSRTIQNLVRILDASYNLRPSTPESVIDYCGTVSNELLDNILPQVFDNSSVGSDAAARLSGVRGDLERLVDERQGVGNRPVGWYGNRDATTPTFLDDLLRDLENFANVELGTGTRPPNWRGIVLDSQALTYLNLRYNLEALADLTLGEGVRPTGWEGMNPAERCDIIPQALVLVVGEQIAPVPPPAETGNQEIVCQQIEANANDYAENPPAVEADVVEGDGLTYRSRLAFSYLDVAALEYMGIMPYDVEFRPWYRNFQDSNMMFVSGENFAVYIDRRFTTMPDEAFRILPSLEGRIPLTFCDANWCNGPGPTPTPTGDSPLVLLLQQATPEPTRDPLVLEQQGKILVSWNNIRVNYLLDRPELGTVQVTLEICADPSQVACEPVTSVFDNTTGTAKPVLSQFNGLNVYEFNYGYSTNFIIEGATRFSRDIWISDPTIRG